MALRQGVVEGEEALAVLARLGQRKKPRLGLLDLLLRREIDGGVVGRIDHVLADQDQLAADGEIVDGAAVVARVDDGGGVGGEPTEILRHGQRGVDRLGVLEEGPERDGRRLLARGDQLGSRLEDLLVQRIVEVVRLEEARDAVVRLVVDEDGAEQRLLGLEVVRCGCGTAAPRWSAPRGEDAISGARGGIGSCARAISRFRPALGRGPRLSSVAIPVLHIGTRICLARESLPARRLTRPPCAGGDRWHLGRAGAARRRTCSRA